MRNASALFVLFLLLPVFSSSIGVSLPAQAASECEGEITTMRWNETAQRQAMVPFSTYANAYSYEEDMMYEGNNAAEPSSNGMGGLDQTLHPESYWMYTPIFPLPTLEPLTTDHYMTMEIGNDSVGALRFNLSSAHRTTFCVSLSSLVENESSPIDADIYLMTSHQYQRYEESYRMMHGGWWWQDIDIAGGDSDLLSDIPPEWRSFNPLGWQTYRDVHQYESRSQATFSVALDNPEVYNSMFGSNEWQDFYLVVDTWSNTHDGDADAPGAVVLADVTVISEPRSILFPTWTVPLMLFGLLFGALLLPILLNKRYMASGLEPKSTVEMPSVPVLEQTAVSPDSSEEETGLSIP